MSAGSIPPDADSVTGEPVLDDAERAEARWLLARERDPGAPAPSSKIASDYAEIEHLLAALPTGAARDAWHDDVLRLARRRAVLRWTRRGALAAAAVAAAAAAVLALMPRPAAELEVAIQHDRKQRGDSTAVVVGDRAIITARPRGPGDLRVYRSNGALVARCPGGPGCQTSAPGEYVIDIVLDMPTEYRVFLVVGMTAGPAAMTIGAYLDAASRANAHVIMYPPIDVR